MDATLLSCCVKLYSGIVWEYTVPLLSLLYLAIMNFHRKFSQRSDRFPKIQFTTTPTTQSQVQIFSTWGFIWWAKFLSITLPPVGMGLLPYMGYIEVWAASQGMGFEGLFSLDRLSCLPCWQCIHTLRVWGIVTVLVHVIGGSFSIIYRTLTEAHPDPGWHTPIQNFCEYPPTKNDYHIPVPSQRSCSLVEKNACLSALIGLEM